MYELIDQIEILTSRRDMSVAESMDAILTSGMSTLKLEIGVVSQIRGDVYRVSRSITNNPQFIQGAIHPLSQTYAAFVVQASSLVAVSAMKISDLRNHLAYRTLRWESYIGLPLIVNGYIFGALEFASEKVQTQPFDELDANSLYVMGAALSELIERDMREQAKRNTREIKI